MASWRLGLKANALYRDGSKLSQPLNTQLFEARAETSPAYYDELSPKPPALQLDVTLQSASPHERQASALPPVRVHAGEKSVELV
jgi:ribonucleotide reductase alpha subunit